MSITHAQVVATAPDGSSDVQSDDWNAGHLISGMAGAPWVDWSPVFKAGANTATWTGAAKYLDLGGTVIWFITATFTGAVASGTISITGQPTALQSHNGADVNGQGFWYDQGVSWYTVQTYPVAAADWRLHRVDAFTDFAVAIGTSPADGVAIWGMVVHSATSFIVPSPSRGTTFPSSPATNDHYYRTDRNLEYYWDGTRWLTTTLYRENIGVTDNLLPITVSATTTGRWAPWHTTDIWLESLYGTNYVTGTNDGSNYWTVDCSKYTAGNTPTVVATYNTSADAASNWVTHTVAIGAIFTAATYKELQVLVTKTGSPAGIYAPTAIAYRLVG